MSRRGEELKLRLAAGRCGDHRHGAAGAPEPLEPAVEVSRRRVLELETALQLAILQRQPRGVGAPARARDVHPERPLCGQEDPGVARPGPAIFTYLTEKLDESLEEPMGPKENRQ